MTKSMICLAGVPLEFAVRYPRAAELLRERPGCLSEAAAVRPDMVSGQSPVTIPEPDWREFIADGFADDPYMEYSLITEYFSDALLARDRIIVHGVALRWRDRAWLICAAPGTGKSTQARFLQELRPGEFGVICGDRPILEFRQSAPRRDGTLPSATSHAPGPSEPRRDGTLPSAASPAPGPSEPRRDGTLPSAASPVPGPSEPRRDGTLPSAASPVPSHCSARSTAEPEDLSPPIIVHPSPWNGKENWHGAEAAPLAGLILLERGDENRLVSLTDREAVVPMYYNLIHSGWETGKIHRVADLETRLLRAVPIWKLTTHEVPDSTCLLLEAVFAGRKAGEP